MSADKYVFWKITKDFMESRGIKIRTLINAGLSEQSVSNLTGGNGHPPPGREDFNLIKKVLADYKGFELIDSSWKDDWYYFRNQEKADSGANASIPVSGKDNGLQNKADFQSSIKNPEFHSGPVQGPADDTKAVPLSGNESKEVKDANGRNGCRLVECGRVETRDVSQTKASFVKSLRLRLGLSQVKFGRLINCSGVTICLAENRKTHLSLPLVEAMYGLDLLTDEERSRMRLLFKELQEETPLDRIAGKDKENPETILDEQDPLPSTEEAVPGKNAAAEKANPLSGNVTWQAPAEEPETSDTKMIVISEPLPVESIVSDTLDTEGSMVSEEPSLPPRIELQEATAAPAKDDSDETAPEDLHLYRKTLGLLLRDTRRELGYDIERAAALACLDQELLEMMERGEALLSLEELSRIVHRLGMLRIKGVLATVINLYARCAAGAYEVTVVGRGQKFIHSAITFLGSLADEC